jgi:hypothetical protein
MQINKVRNVHKTSRPSGSVLRRAYIGLMFAPEAADGSRSIKLCRYGAFEVRLVELPNGDLFAAAPLWIELYRHDIRQSLISRRCDDLDDAEAAAENLIARAKELDQSYSSSLSRADTPVSAAGRFFASSLSRWRSSASASRRV